MGRAPGVGYKGPTLVAVLSHLYLNIAVKTPREGQPPKRRHNATVDEENFDQQWRKERLPLTAEAEAGSYPATGLAKVKPFFN